MASRWSISTMPLRRRSRARCSTGSTHFYEHEYANVHRGLHYLANAATDAYEAARESVRRFLNAGSVEEIVFTRSATEAINLVASSFGLDHIGEGDEIVLSVMEHHANIVPWHFHRERKGAVLKWVDVADDGSFSLEAFERGADRSARRSSRSRRCRTCSGTATPIEGDRRDRPCAWHSRAGRRLAGRRAWRGRRARARRRFLRDDRPQALRPDRHRRALRQGRAARGAAAVQRRRRDDRGRDARQRSPTTSRRIASRPARRRSRRRSASAPRSTIIEGVGRARIAAHEAALSAYAHERLSRINSLRIFGTAPGKGPILSFTMEGAHAHDIATIIDRAGVAVRAGTHCAMPLLQRFGVTSTCRASFALYNTLEEVDALADALVRAHKLFA